ncbi:MAG: RNA methyltransferase [Bacteroides sp.]|nr:RNA methyltransferase [Bacteroides sp.]MCM1548371.1 RNA methyltransferase [Clostridium sp.]
MITSTSNPQIKNIVKLQKSSKSRREQQVFLVEGIRMFREIPEALLVKAYVTEDWLGELPTAWEEGRQYELISNGVLKEISDTQTPQGILAIVRQQTYQREELLGGGSKAGKTPCVLVLENLQDPGNLGTILRTAEGAGVTGILMSKDTVDIYNSKVVRATMGAIFRMPFRYEVSISDGVDWLKTQGIRCYAAHLDGACLYEYDFRDACCFLIGNEGNGLTDTLAAQADHFLRIPMEGKVESLNAATAAAVLMYETLRQRL